MASPLPPPARWPTRLAEAVATLRGAPPAGRPRARSATWPVLHAALFASLRAQAGRITQVCHEDLEDLASQKSLELLLRAEEGTWDPGDRAEHEVAGYVSRVARHALVDLARRRGRECPAPEDPEAWAVAIAESAGEAVRPEDRMAAREFARALRACVEALAPRARQAWFRRVFLERPSREIGERLGLSAAHVDVVVQRARAALRSCMQEKGHSDAAMRPGAFVEIWASLEQGAIAGCAEERANERE
jgi:RNA polymerase sigma-70 factor (ECF subfamily)